MSIFKRGNVYWYHFLFNGEHLQASTKQGNPQVARQIEAARRTALAKGEVGIEERKAAPKFVDFAKRFLAHVEARHENKPATVLFYSTKLNRLQKFQPISSSRIDLIDEGLIENYVVERRKSVGPTTVNRELATLRRMLRLAHEWKEIQRVPRIRLLSGERTRDFVLSRQQEKTYLAACPQPLHDIAVLMLESGLRIGEALSLEWENVTLEPVNGARFGFIRVREGKSKNARRIVPLTDRASAMLTERKKANDVRKLTQKIADRVEQQKAKPSPYVFANREGERYLGTSINHLHRNVCAPKVDGKRGLPCRFCAPLFTPYNAYKTRRIGSGCFHHHADRRAQQHCRFAAVYPSDAGSGRARFRTFAARRQGRGDRAESTPTRYIFRYSQTASVCKSLKGL